MSGLEIEIKYEVDTHSNLVLSSAKLISAGLEQNSYIDFNKSLSSKGSSLRVRGYNNEVIITLKEKGVILPSGVKKKPETNIPLNYDFNETLRFFSKIGAAETGYYEKKHRAIMDLVFKKEHFAICLDTIVANKNERYFIEIEGSEESKILELADKIGINNPKLNTRVIKSSYYELFAMPRANPIF